MMGGKPNFKSSKIDKNQKDQQVPSGEKKKDTAPKYNPYGTGTANPSNMSGSTGP